MLAAMRDERLLSIGNFARQTGLSIGALRHYHEMGLITPARVDPHTGYRAYSAAQLEDARLVARLRELDVTLPEIGRLLRSSGGERAATLAAQRARLAGLLARTQRQIHWLNQAIDKEEPLVTRTTRPGLDPETQRQIAVDLFNHVWTLIEMPARSAAQDDEMLHAAHASRHHWGAVGEPVNLVRGEWQCSRVYAVFGRAEPATWHARRCLQLCEEHAIGGFDIGFAYEALARAQRLAGAHAEADASVARARELAAEIADDEDRELLLSDLETA